MSTTKNVEHDEAADSTTTPKDYTPWAARRPLSDPQLRNHFDRIMVFVERGEKQPAFDALATLRADLKKFHQLLLAKEDEQKARDNDPAKENATAPASSAELLALQKQVEQLCNASKRSATAEIDLRAEVAQMKNEMQESTLQWKTFRRNGAWLSKGSNVGPSSSTNGFPSS